MQLLDQDPRFSCTYRAATAQLLVSLLSFRQHQATPYQRLIPGGPDDLLWWCLEGESGGMLDHLVGVLVEMCGMCEQGALLGMDGESREVMEGFSQVRRLGGRWRVEEAAGRPRGKGAWGQQQVPLLGLEKDTMDGCGCVCMLRKMDCGYGGKGEKHGRRGKEGASREATGVQ